jgi:hypothetical protein
VQDHPHGYQAGECLRQGAVSPVQFIIESKKSCSICH